MALLDWTSGFEADPMDSDKIHLGDDEIRETREEVRIRAQMVSNWGSIATGFDDDGRILPGTAKAYYQSGDPTQYPRNPENDAYPTHALTLAGARDQGLLAVDTAANNRLKVFGSGGTWEDIHAANGVPSPVFGVSTANTGIGTGATTLSWSTTPTITLPSEGDWLLMAFGEVQVENINGSNDVLVRCDLELSSPVALTYSTQEIMLKSRSGTEDARGVFPFHYVSTATAGQTYTFVVKAAADTASRAQFAGGVTQLSDADFETEANSTQHRLTIMAVPR